jgi:hypothetical protein
VRRGLSSSVRLTIDVDESAAYGGRAEAAATRSSVALGTRLDCVEPTGCCSCFAASEQQYMPPRLGPVRRCFPSAGPRQERFEPRAVVARLVPCGSDPGVRADGCSASASDSAGALASRRGWDRRQAHRRFPRPRQRRSAGRARPGTRRSTTPRCAPLAKPGKLQPSYAVGVFPRMSAKEGRGGSAMLSAVSEGAGYLDPRSVEDAGDERDSGFGAIVVAPSVRHWPDIPVLPSLATPVLARSTICPATWTRTSRPWSS